MFANHNNYASSSASPYAPRPAEPLQFFGASGGSQSAGSSFYQAVPNSLDGAIGGGGGPGGGYAQGNMDMAGGRIMSEGKWWEAFGTGGFEGEASLMEGESRSFSGVGTTADPLIWAELGINPSHILAKSLTVLNPLSRVDPHVMDDADLAGPFVFCFGFALVLLLVCLSIGLNTVYRLINLFG